MLNHNLVDFINKLGVIRRKAELLEDAYRLGLTETDPNIQYLIDDIQALALEVAKDKKGNELK